MTLRILLRSLLPAALALAAAAPASAQSDVRMTVNIPFAFQADGHLLPPGHYAVDKILSVFLRLRPADAGKGNVTASVLFMHDKTTRILDHAVVGFTCYAQQCFLRQVQQANTDEYLRVVPTRAEKRAQHESLLASAPRDVTVLPQLALLESR